jgi:hypothetical protein
LSTQETDCLLELGLEEVLELVGVGGELDDTCTRGIATESAGTSTVWHEETVGARQPRWPSQKASKDALRRLTLRKLLVGHRVLNKRPPERRLVVDERGLAHGLGLAGLFGREDAREVFGRVLELLEEGGRDGEEVAAGEVGDLASLFLGEGGEGGER